MARIVLTSWGSHGDLNPFLGLAIALRERGHQPVLAVPAHYRPQVEAEGMRIHPVRPDIDPGDRALISRIMHPRTGTEVIVRELLVPRIRESYADLWAATEGADLLVSHPITFAAPLVGARRGMRWLSAVLAPMSFFSRHEIPAFPPAPWTARLNGVPGAGRMLTTLARAATRGWTKPVRELRRELELPDAGDPVFDGQFSPHGTLALYSRVLGAPQPDWPARVAVTGFVFYDRSSGEQAGPAVRSWLDAGPAPIVFTLGSSAAATGTAAARFFGESVAAARSLGRRALLLVGSNPANRPVLGNDESVWVTEAAPYSEIFPRAAAVVHQGGIGTTAQALAAGIPQLVVPFAHDQPDNAVRVERLGVARWVAATRYEARRSARLLGELLRGTRYTARAAAVGREVRSEDGPAAACDAIDAALAGA
jgi:UDP:flavonoid glycosyltransferase YjiC (YdhE family)